jgi:hypothetical protein
MKKSVHITLAVGVLAGAATALAPCAFGAPSDVGTAQDTVNRLQGLGYHVSINGPVTSALSDCLVTGVHPSDPGAAPPSQFSTVWIDVSCRPTNN